MESYLVPRGYGEAEFVEKRSRFIGQLWRVETEEAHGVGDLLLQKDVQHGLSRRALGLAVIAVAQDVPLPEDVAEAVVPGVGTGAVG